MFRVEMAGLFVALISLIRGAELPCKAYLLEPPGLSAGEGSNMMVTRVLLDVAVLMPAALVGLPLYFGFPEAQGSNLLFVDSVATGTMAAVAFLVRRRVQRRAGKRTPHISGSGWQAKAGAKICGFLRDMHRSFAAYWRPGHRGTLLYAIALTTVYLDTAPLRRPFGVDGGWVVRNWPPVVVEVDVELDGRPLRSGGGDGVLRGGRGPDQRRQALRGFGGAGQRVASAE